MERIKKAAATLLLLVMGVVFAAICAGGIVLDNREVDAWILQATGR